jgi:hypothetical protein
MLYPVGKSKYHVTREVHSTKVSLQGCGTIVDVDIRNILLLASDMSLAIWPGTCTTNMLCDLY